MSGPKVVRIQTREEIIAICQEFLCQVDYEVSEWHRVGNRNQVLTEADGIEVATRRSSIAQLAASGELTRLPEETEKFINWLRLDITTRLEQQFSKHSRARRESQSLSVTAASILRQLDERQINISDETRRTLEETKAQSLKSFEQSAQIVARAMSLLRSSPQDAVDQQSERYKSLRKGLSADGSNLQLDDWLAKQVVDDSQDTRFGSIEKLLDQLSTVDDTDIRKDFADRLESLRMEPASQQLSLKLDAMAAAVSKKLQHSKAASVVRRDLYLLQATSRAAGCYESLRSDFQRLDDLVSRDLEEEVPGLLELIRQKVQATAEARRDESRRHVFLDGLQRLGYKVNEGMSTLWAKQGRLLVRNAAQQSTAVEISGNLQTGRLQLRMVAIEGTSPRNQTDKQVEEEWCSNFHELTELLSHDGTKLSIEKAIVAGSRPLKVIANDWIDDDTESGGIQQRAIR